MKTDNSYKHILKLTSVFGGVQFLNIAIALVRNKLVALLLGPDGMGLMSLLNSTTGMLSNVIQMGIPTSGVREISQYDEEPYEQRRRINTVRVWSFLLGMVGALICAVFSPLLNKFTFTWGDHTLHFFLLSPVVLFSSMACGELAIMKGTYQMRRLAKRSVMNIIAALFISVPLFYFFGEAGIVPSMVLMAACQYFINMSGVVHKEEIRDAINLGRPILKLGLAFVVAGLFGSGSDFLIRTYLNNVADLSVVGYYNTGYMISVTYGGMLFAAMESDYYPRLSAVSSLGKEFNGVVNKQAEILLMVAGPFVLLLVMLMPFIIPLLFSKEFVEVIPMAQFAVIGLLARASYLPVEYISLARGDGRSFMVIDCISYVLVLLSVIIGYEYWGLTGTGYAIAFSAFLNYLFDLCYARWRFKFVPSLRSILILLLEMAVIGLCLML